MSSRLVTKAKVRCRSFTIRARLDVIGVGSPPCSRHASTDAAFMTALLVQSLYTTAANVADMTEAQRHQVVGCPGHLPTSQSSLSACGRRLRTVRQPALATLSGRTPGFRAARSRAV